MWLLVAARLSAIRAVEVEREAEDEPELGATADPRADPRAGGRDRSGAPGSGRRDAGRRGGADRCRDIRARARDRLPVGPRAADLRRAAVVLAARGVAKTVVDEVVRLEREGKAQEADALVQQLQAM